MAVARPEGEGARVSVGRTSWYPSDSAEHDRELIVELGLQFGSDGPYLMRVMKDLAQQQRDPDGRVLTGFQVLARKTFVAGAERVREVVECAAAIGALDDLVIDEDGRRFTCRVSGWKADGARGRAAIRKAAQRGGDAPDDPGDMSLSDGTSHAEACQEGELSRSVPLPDITIEEEQPSSVGHPPDDEPEVEVDPQVLRLSVLLGDLIAERDSKAAAAVKAKATGKRWLTDMRLLLADRQGDVAEVERVLRWSQADAFWQANILSPSKLRQQFVALAQRAKGAHLRPVPDPTREARRQRSTDALRALAEQQQPGGTA